MGKIDKGLYLLGRTIRSSILGQAPGLRAVLYHYLNATTQPSFEQHLIYFREHYETPTVSDILEDPDKYTDKPSLLITFDDGYAKVFEYGVPVLRKHSVPALFFVCPDFITDDRTPTPEWRSFYENMTGQSAYIDTLKTWGELKQLLEWGFEIGSHTASHKKLSTLSQKELDYEIKGGKEKLEDRLNVPIDTFAIPYGDATAYNENVLNKVAEAGFKACFTALRGINTTPMKSRALKRFALEPQWSTSLVRVYLS